MGTKFDSGSLSRLRWVSSPACLRLRELLVVTCLVAAGQPTNAAPPPAEVFGALPAETQPSLSPDSHWIAWLDETESKPHIVVFDLEARRIQRVGALPQQMSLRSLQWSDNETLLATVSAVGAPKVATGRATASFITLAMNPTGEGALMLPSFKASSRRADIISAIHAGMVRASTTKPHTIIMFSGPSLLEVDTNTGDSERIKLGNEHTVYWAVDRDGKPVAREDWDWKTGSYRLYALKGEGIKEILRNDDKHAPTLMGVLPDDSGLVLLANNGHAHQCAWALPLDGSAQKLLAEDPDADITATYTDPYTGAVVGFYESGTKTSIQWLDPAAQHRQDVLQRSFPKQQVEVYGWSRDGNKTLARVQSPSSPPIYYLIDFQTHRADIAAEEYPQLAGVKLAELKEISYKARDGTDIPAYLTVPSEAASELPPLVVLPHEGPNQRDYPTFNWLVQFLASRGYAVLQPQFRGSSGFGEAFEKAGYRQWGGRMQDDVTDGVRAMIDQKLVDPRRVCIMGWGYGGYVALAGAAFTPDLYACAISVSGISDLRALLEETVPQSTALVDMHSASMSAWTERIGAPGDSALDRKSPIHSVASIKAPILIVYGRGDSVVPNAQSLKMEEALRTAGKQVSLINVSGGVSPAAIRVQMLRAFDDFLRDSLQKPEAR